MLKRMIKAIQKTSHFFNKIGRKHLASSQKNTNFAPLSRNRCQRRVT